VEKYGIRRQTTDDSIIWCMHLACWVKKATDTYSEFVIFIAFPRQQWLRECASTLHLYVHCMSCLYPVFGMEKEARLPQRAVYLLVASDWASRESIHFQFQVSCKIQVTEHGHSTHQG